MPKTILDGPVSIIDLMKRNQAAIRDRKIRAAIKDPNTPTWVLNMIADIQSRKAGK